MNIFGEFAKVLSVKYLLKEEFAKLKFAKFRDFLISRNFLPAKLSALKVLTKEEQPWFAPTGKFFNFDLLNWLKTTLFQTDLDQKSSQK